MPSNREHWTLQEWREYAEALEQGLRDAAAQHVEAADLLGHINKVLAEASTKITRQATAVKTLRFIEQAIARGEIEMRLTANKKKKSGRPRKMTLKTAEELVRQADQFKTATDAAKSLAAEALRQQGLIPQQHSTRLGQVTDTTKNNISAARKLIREAQARRARPALSNVDWFKKYG